MIQIEEIWLCAQPCDMRRGMDTLLNQVVQSFGSAQAHHAYLFANKSANRMKVLAHDGFGIWLCNRRLHKGKFDWLWQSVEQGQIHLDRHLFDALIVGLPWQRLDYYSDIKQA